MTREEFVQGFAERSKLTVEDLEKRGLRAYECDCPADNCGGWQVLSDESARQKLALGQMTQRAFQEGQRGAREYPAKVPLLKVDVPCPIGYTYSAEALKRAAENDPRMEFDGETLWYLNVTDEADEAQAWMKVGVSSKRLRG